jgi:hypothetical protein
MTARQSLPLVVAVLGLAGGAAILVGPWLSGKYSDNGQGLCLSAPLPFEDHMLAGCVRRSDIQALEDEPVSLGANTADKGVVLTDPGNVNAQRVVRTCRDYDAAVKTGWYALTTYDISMESFFKRTCGVLALLANGGPAKQSFLGPPTEGFGNADRVGASAIAALAPEARGLTIGDLVRSGGVTIEAEEARRLVVTANGLRGELTEIARGDFDGDGIADILAFFSVHAQNGSFRSYEVLVLTRKKSERPLEVSRTFGGTKEE